MVRVNLLTAEEVAARLSIDKTTVYRLARSGELPSLKLAPKIIRFDPVRLEEWIESKAVGRPVGKAVGSPPHRMPLTTIRDIRVTFPDQRV